LQTKSILNKLTREKFAILSSKLIEEIQHGVRTSEELQQIVDLIYEKALSDIFLADLYAQLIETLTLQLSSLVLSSSSSSEVVSSVSSTLDGSAGDSTSSSFVCSSTQVTVRSLLLERCQKEFHSTILPTASLSSVPPSLSSANDEVEQSSSSEYKQKHRKMANIKFIAELYKRNLVRSMVIQECLETLLASTSQLVGEEEIEATKGLLLSVVPKIFSSHNDAAGLLRPHLACIRHLLEQGTLSPRARFMMKDVLEHCGKYMELPRLVDTASDHLSCTSSAASPSLSSSSVAAPLQNSTDITLSANNFPLSQPVSVVTPLVVELPSSSTLTPTATARRHPHARSHSSQQKPPGAARIGSRKKNG